MLCLFLWGFGGPGDRASGRPADDPATEAPSTMEVGPSAPARATIRFGGGRFLFEAQNAPWSAVLQELERETGVTVEVKGSLSGTVSDRFEAGGLQEGLRRLFRGANVVMMYGGDEAGEARPTMRAWVFATATASPPPIAAGEIAPEAAEDAASATDQKPVEAALIDFDRDVQMRALDALLAMDRAQAIHTLVKLTQNGDLIARLQSLALLHESGAADGATLVFALGAAVTDKHPGVRDYAVEVLATRPEPEAIGHLERAFGDADARTRIRILENVGEFPHGRRILERALSDSDETVRTFARDLLGQGAPAGE